MNYEPTFRSVRVCNQKASTTGKWLKEDWFSVGALIGVLMLIGVGGRIAQTLGLI